MYTYVFGVHNLDLVHPNMFATLNMPITAFALSIHALIAYPAPMASSAIKLHWYTHKPPSTSQVLV
jgi:hypothetical protein